MPIAESFTVAGVDGCKAGWLVAGAFVTRAGSEPADGVVYQAGDLRVAPTFAEVLSVTMECSLVCVDIPIGLTDGPPRECDLLARKMLSPFRASSVFPAPIRPCLAARDYTSATAISREVSGKALTKQSFAILAKIRQVDDLMTPELQNRVREIHPEVCFWSLNGNRPVEHNKKTPPGQLHRYRVLKEVFTCLDDVIGVAPARGCAMDDVLDAFVAAWTAGQAVLGKVITLPENPPRDTKRLRMEMVCPMR